MRLDYAFASALEQGIVNTPAKVQQIVASNPEIVNDPANKLGIANAPAPMPAFFDSTTTQPGLANDPELVPGSLLPSATFCCSIMSLSFSTLATTDFNPYADRPSLGQEIRSLTFSTQFYLLDIDKMQAGYIDSLGQPSCFPASLHFGPAAL